ncbi:uncharacterized protein [Montipora capricornis]|uniref:uncharacterized protein n=1 Tax=Montipora capricornis TaxID=246305 RepID=UPI0035F156FB
MRGILTVCYFAFHVVAFTKSFPIKKSVPVCQRNNRIRLLLRSALVLSHELARRSTAISQEVSRRWPLNPYQDSNVDFILPIGSFNKTADKPLTILKTNYRILKTCILLLDNSTIELDKFQAARSVVTQLRELKDQTETLILCLKKIMERMGFDQNERADNDETEPPKTEVMKTLISNAPTIEDASLRTKLLLDELSSRVANDLITDIWKIKILTCN